MTQSKVEPIINSDTMHNRNCFAYLCQLKPYSTQTTLSVVPELSVLNEQHLVEYNEQFAYGDLYSKLIAHLEDKIDALTPDKLPHLDDLIHAIYHNDNRILEQTQWLNAIGNAKTPQSSTNSKIKSKLKDPVHPVNKMSPQKSANLYHALVSLFTPNFKPQHSTNIPTIKNYSRKKDDSVIEYRFSTQAQRHNGKVRISPLFKRWLTIKAAKLPESASTAHIYFNNLGLDRTNLDIPGSRERELTLALHQFELDHPELKLAVITLPASHGLMELSNIYKEEKNQPYQNVFNEFMQRCEGSFSQKTVGDFWISPTTRIKLFGTNSQSALYPLIAQSFHDLNIHSNDTISKSQKQAAWLHFTKYYLSNYILNTLKPQSFNFSCKDAIDRGAVSSTYFNLMKSFEKGNTPLQKDEFERNLDAAAASVRGRGMNFQRHIIWNAINTYTHAHYSEFYSQPEKSWLIYWRDMNCPRSSVTPLLKLRLEQCRNQFTNLPADSRTIQEKGLAVIKNLESQISFTSRRLLLEIISRTEALLSSPSKATFERYKHCAEELELKYPALHLLAGLMKTLLGVMLFIPTLGYSQPLIDHGVRTFKSGFFAPQKLLLKQQMEEYADQLKPPSVA